MVLLWDHPFGGGVALGSPLRKIILDTCEVSVKHMRGHSLHSHKYKSGPGERGAGEVFERHQEREDQLSPWGGAC